MPMIKVWYYCFFTLPILWVKCILRLILYTDYVYFMIYLFVLLYNMMHCQLFKIFSCQVLLLLQALYNTDMYVFLSYCEQVYSLTGSFKIYDV